ATALIALALVAGTLTTAYQARKAERRTAEVRELAGALLFDIHDAIRDLPGATPAREALVRRALAYLDDLHREASGDPALALDEVGPLLGTPPVRQRAAALALEAHRRLGMEPPVGAAWLDAAESGAPGLRWACAECRWQAPDWRFDCGGCGRLGTMLPDEAAPALPA
ncbi:MAG: hypothetical protein AAGD40_01620, partial [Pseudomonadota bacterium]